MPKTGVVFSNLGTPRSPSPQDVASYLKEFLMDPQVITLPYLLRAILVYGIIAPFRSKKSAKAYQKIWTSQGSPLRYNTEIAAKALQQELGDKYKVVTAMRYGEPSFDQAKEQLADCEEIILFQQYPQFADSTTTTGEEHFKNVFAGSSYKIVPPYYNHPEFIKSYVAFLQYKLSNIQADHLLMSFHGLPEDHIRSADPTGTHCLKVNNCCDNSEPVIAKCYRAQCMTSARLIADGLNYSNEQFSVSFQSRLGKQKWIEPYTEDTFKTLIDKGVKKLAVTCPGFSVDGLETLEEIAMEGKETFLELGGEEFHYLPCLNDDADWIKASAVVLKETENRIV